MNWVTPNFMWARNVSMLGTLRGGGARFVSAAHILQWCRLPGLCQAHKIQIEELGGGDFETPKKCCSL